MRTFNNLTCLRGCAGQSTVEYLVTGLALLVIILVLGVLAERLSKGLFTEHTAQNASHAITENSAGSIGDVVLY